jgi:Fic family protein
MKTFIDLDKSLARQPLRLGALLARIDRGAGREELYRDQLPELLQSLAEQTRVASITASNAIEGVVLEPGRAERIIANPESHFRNRTEREFAGYRDAVDYLMNERESKPPSLAEILAMHGQLFLHTDGRGGYLKTDDNVIASIQPDGTRRIIFEPPSWRHTESLMRSLMDGYNDAVERQLAHPFILVAALVLDFLAIHPVGDGNGRLARLLTTKELLRNGYGVARYVSVEQRVFDTKNSYYDALEASQTGWHEAAHDIWPWTEYLAVTVAGAYDAFEQRLADARELTGSKQDRVRTWALNHAPRDFNISDVRRALPGISDPTIRLVLNQLRDENLLRADGPGRSARWTRITPSGPPAER